MRRRAGSWTTMAVALALTAAVLASPRTAHAEVGLADLGPPPASAVRHNDAGVTLLAKGALDAAKIELRAAVADSPSFTLARYNLACALARSQQTADAARELAQVFEEDFIGTRAHAAVDPDLAPLWATPDGQTLAGRIPSYATRYQGVLDRGVRAILWHDPSKPGGDPTADRAFLRPDYLRVGVFEPATRRFVPVAPRLPRTIRVFAPPNVPYAVVLTGEVRSTLGGDLDPGQAIDSLRTYRFDTSGEPSGEIPLAKLEPYTARLSLADDRLELDLHTVMPIAPSSDSYDARYQLTFGHPAQRQLATNAFTAPASFDVYRTHIDAGYNHWGPTMFASDARFVYRATARERTLTFPGGQKVIIPASLAYRQRTPRILADAAGEHVLLSWNAEQSQCEGTELPGRYQLTLVTRTGSVVTALGSGPGASAGAFDAAGHLYVQRDRRVVEVSFPSLSETPLPVGVLLAPPNIDAPECGF